MLTHFRIHSFLLFIFLSFLNPLLGRDQSSSPRPFYGFWSVQEKSGETCFLNIKPGGRASCFWSGNRSTQLQKGHYTLEDKGLVIEWPGGFHYLIEKKTENTILRHFYPKGRSLDEAPEESLYGQKYDRRMVGMLVEEKKSVDEASVEAQPAVTEDADEATSEGKDIAGTIQDSPEAEPVSSSDPNPKIKANEGGFAGQHFAGYWKIVVKDSLWGLMGSKDYYVKITRDGVIEGAPGNMDRFLAGRWQLKGDVLRILWTDITYSELTPLEENHFELALFSKDRKEVESRFEMVRLSVDEGARFFEAGTAKSLGVQDILGVWIKFPPENYTFSYIDVQRWGKVTKYAGDDSVLIKGEWSVDDDTLNIVWNDGRFSALKLGAEGFVQSEYENSGSLEELPEDSFAVTRIPADKVGALREDMKRLYQKKGRL